MVLVKWLAYTNFYPVKEAWLSWPCFFYKMFFVKYFLFTWIGNLKLKIRGSQIMTSRMLGVTAEAIKNFSEEAVFNYFNTFHDSSSGDFRHHCTFNPIDKIIELYDEKVALLERLLQSEREKNQMLKGK